MDLAEDNSCESAGPPRAEDGEEVFILTAPIVASDRFEDIKALKIKEFSLRTDILQEIILWHDRFNPKKYLVEFHKNVNSAGSCKSTLICPDKNCGFNISIRYYKGSWKICKHSNFLEQLIHKDTCTVDTTNAAADDSQGICENDWNGSIVNDDESVAILKSREFSSRAEALNAIREWQASLNPPKHVIGSGKTSSNKVICPDSNCEFNVSIERVRVNNTQIWKMVSPSDSTERLHHSKGCTISGKNRLVRLCSPAIGLDIATSSSTTNNTEANQVDNNGNPTALSDSNDDILSALKMRDFSCRSEVVHEVQLWHDRSFPEKCLVAFRREKRSLKLHTLVCPDVNCGFNISMQYIFQNHVGIWKIGIDPDFIEQLYHKDICATARPEPVTIVGVPDDHSTSAQGEADVKTSSNMENLGILASCAQILDDDGIGSSSSSSSHIHNSSNNEDEIAALKNREFSSRPEIVHAISLWQARQQPPKHLVGCNKSRCSSRHTLVCSDRNCGFNISIQCIIKNFAGTWRIGSHPDFVEQLQHSAECTPPVAGKVRARVAAEILLEKGKLDLKGKALMQKSQEMGFHLGKSFFSNKRFEGLGPPKKTVKKRYSSKEKVGEPETPATEDGDIGGGNSNSSGSGNGSGKEISEEQKALMRRRAREGMAKYRSEMTAEQRSEERRKARAAMARYRAQLNMNILQRSELHENQSQHSQQGQRTWSKDSSVNSNTGGSGSAMSEGNGEPPQQQQDSSNWELVCTKMRMHIDQMTQNPLDEIVEIGDVYPPKQPELGEDVAVVVDGSADSALPRKRGRKRRVRDEDM
eukprot:gene26462-35120_t